MKKIGVLIFNFLAVQTLSAQLEKTQIQFELGTAVCFGKNSYKLLETPNSLSVVHPQNIRYRYPSLRARVNAFYNLTPLYSVFLTSGINTHFSEFYYYGQYTNTISIPLQIGGQVQASRNHLNYLLAMRGGVNFMKIDQSPFTDRGGALYTIEIGLSSDKKTQNGFRYRLGFERQTDNVLLRFDSPTQMLKSA